MRIISTLLPPEPEGLVDGRQTIVMALDTLVGEKSVVVGLTVGTVDGPDIDQVRISPVGHRVLARASSHHLLNYPNAPVVVVGVASVTGAKQRVRKVLANAPPQALVLLVCADDKVYDAAYPALGVDLKAMHVGPQ